MLRAGSICEGDGLREFPWWRGFWLEGLHVLAVSNEFLIRVGWMRRYFRGVLGLKSMFCGGLFGRGREVLGLPEILRSETSYDYLSSAK